MSNTLNVTLIQTTLFWEDKSANLQMFDDYFQDINESDLIVLPEMFTTGFSMNPKDHAESMDGPTVSWMKNWSRQLNAAIVGSIIIKEKGHYFNRLLFVFPHGEIETYDKRHLFSLAGEEKFYSSGKDKRVVDFKGWKICPLICYDLRFPVWARNVEAYDLLLYVANWPARRKEAWQTLLKARAIENQSFVLGVNRVGPDGNNIDHSGNSIVHDPLGNDLSQMRESESQVFQITLSKNDLQEVRNKFSFLADRDTFSITGRLH